MKKKQDLKKILNRKIHSQNAQNSIYKNAAKISLKALDTSDKYEY